MPRQRQSSPIDLTQSSPIDLPSSPTPALHRTFFDYVNVDNLFNHGRLLASSDLCVIECDLLEQTVTLSGNPLTILDIIDSFMWTARNFSTSTACLRDGTGQTMVIHCVRVKREFMRALTTLLAMMGYMGVKWQTSTMLSFECTYVGPGVRVSTYVHRKCMYCSADENRPCVFFKPC